MQKTIVAFSEKGRELIEKLNKEAVKAGIEPAHDRSGEDISLQDLAREEFAAGHALIFVGAAGIAVRAVSGCVNDKLTDSPVIVIDDNGTFVIPILSGHAGGANKIAATLAALIDALPVITTSTDVNGEFSPDVFAAENRLTIQDRKGIKTVSAKALEGKSITISVKDFPPEHKTDIIVADDTDREYSLLLSPKRYILGVGTRKGKPPEEFESFILSVLDDNGLDVSDIYAIATIDIKEEEEAVRAFSDRYRIPVITFEASLLERAQGDFDSSEFVAETVGVDNVCERAAVLASGGFGQIICKKVKGDGMTAAVVKRG